MKTRFFDFTMVLLIGSLVFWVGCTQGTKTNVGPGVSTKTVASTEVTVEVVETAPKISCEGAVNGEKVTDRKDSTFTVQIPVDCFASDSIIQSAGYVYPGPRLDSDFMPVHEGGEPVKSAANPFWNNVPWEWLWWLLLLAGIILLAILFWGLLRRLLNWGSAPLTPYQAQQGPVQQPQQVVPMVQIPVNSIYLGPKAPGESRKTLIEEFPVETTPAR